MEEAHLHSWWYVLGCLDHKYFYSEFVFLDPQNMDPNIILNAFG